MVYYAVTMFSRSVIWVDNAVTYTHVYIQSIYMDVTRIRRSILRVYRAVTMICRPVVRVYMYKV